MTWALLRSLSVNDAEIVAQTVLGGAGEPLPHFLDLMKEARDWAFYANKREIEAYAVACFEAMPERRQRAFSGYIQRRVQQ